MTHSEIIFKIAAKVKSTIELPLPCFDFSYWKGYCNATEDINGIGRNDIWVPVKVIALEYCDKLRDGKPIAGIS